MPSPDHRRSLTGRTRSSESALGLQGMSIGAGPRFAMKVLLAVIASWLAPLLPVDFLLAHLSLETAWGSPGRAVGAWMASLSISAAFRSSGSCHGSFAGPQLLSAPSCFVPVLLLVWRGLLGCFCFARKDFSAHLHPYLTLALKQEARYRRLLQQPVELGEVLGRASGGQSCGVRCGADTRLWCRDATSSTAVSPTSPPLSLSSHPSSIVEIGISSPIPIPCGLHQAAFEGGSTSGWG